MNKTKGYKRSYSFYLGAIVGVVVFFLIYGIGVVIPTNVTWLHHSIDLEGLADLTQHELGWEMYRQAPWHFPYGLFDGLSPEPLSIVYTDSIPLFAVFFKILSPILPADFQYMGLFSLITYILMGGLGALIAAKYSHENISSERMGYITDACAAVLMVVSPVLTKRVFYHTALSAHYLILAAILIVIYKRELGNEMQRLLFALLVVLCVDINAYYIPMVMGIYLCGILYDLLSKKQDVLGDFLTVIVSGILSLLEGFFLGMFSGSVSSSAENMESVSYNLVGLINPRNDLLIHLKDMPLYDYQSHESYSLFWDGISVYTPWQSEGFSYLGLGVILLIVAIAADALLFKKDNIMKNKRLLISMLVVGAGFLLLAAGPTGSLGKKELYHIPLPDTIYRLLSVFRTTGRFIWVIYFGIMALVIVQIARYGRRGWLWVLVICTVIQLVDISPSLVKKHEIYAGATTDDTYVNELSDTEVFSYLGQQCDEIIFVNPTTAIRMRPYWSTVFEEYAIEHGMSMDAAYCSRDTTASADAYSDENLKRRQSGERFPNILYVFINDDIMYEQAPKFDLNVYRYENIYIGTDLDLSGFKDVETIADYEKQ